MSSVTSAVSILDGGAAAADSVLLPSWAGPQRHPYGQLTNAFTSTLCVLGIPICQPITVEQGFQAGTVQGRNLMRST